MKDYIGKKIREARKAAGLTQAQLAEKSGVAAITIHQYEARKRQPRVKQLADIAAALNISVDSLLTFEAPTESTVEVRHGRWMEVEVTNGEDIETHLDIVSMWCNKCHRYHATIYYYGNPTEMMNYCPNCGAKMDGGVEEEE